MPILPTYKVTDDTVTDDTYVLPSYLPVPDAPVPGFGTILVNSYLIKAQEPTLVDAGMPIVKEEFLQSLWSLIDPRDLRWIFLTHDDGDHTGALMEVLEAAPQARVITQFVGMARLETCHHLPLERMRILNPGDKFNAGNPAASVI
jgi:flavorubredoxin